MSMIEMALWAPLCAVHPDDPAVVHAATMGDLVAAFDGRATVTAACGTADCKICATAQGTVVLWPISTRRLAPCSRCRPCWTATGKRRPRSRVAA